jgi:hypothetical protein
VWIAIRDGIFSMIRGFLYFEARLIDAEKLQHAAEIASIETALRDCGCLI